MSNVARNLARDHIDQAVSITLKGTTYKGLLTNISHSRHHRFTVHVLIMSSDNAVIQGSLYLPLDHPITFTGEHHV